MDAHTGVRLATILSDEVHEAAARARRYDLVRTSASASRRVAGSRTARIAAGVAAGVVAATLMLASWSPADAAGQVLQTGVAIPVVRAEDRMEAIQPADPPARLRPRSHQTSSNQPDAFSLLVAAAVGAAVVGGIAARTRRVAGKDEPGRVGAKVAPGGSIPAK
jgi:hypothetical protein